MERFRQICLAAIEQQIPLEPRQALGLALGRIDDPRILDPLDPAGYVRIQPGRYPFQKDWIEIKKAYWLSCYPVTNSQFARCGGSWIHGTRSARAAARNVNDYPVVRCGVTGFRVLLYLRQD